MIRVRWAASFIFTIASAAAGCMTLFCATLPAPPDTGLAAYRDHLTKLQGVVSNCQKQRNAIVCDVSAVGADDQITVSLGAQTITREVRYDWVRTVLARAGSKDDAPQNVLPILNRSTRSINDLLIDAQKRLASDAQQADSPAIVKAQYESEHQAISAILSRPEYRSARKTSWRQRVLEWLSRLLDKLFGRLFGLGAQMPWLAGAVRDLLIGIVCLALVWFLIRLERKSRIRNSLDPILSSTSPSAREWQLWLADARAMEKQGAWREAIHFLYWAVISKLESRNIWPADKARTPREYLRLVANNDPRKQPLTTLTRSFERTWYAGRAAQLADYEQAAQLAEVLGVK